MDIKAIMGILKQRYPFLMVDRITECDNTHTTGYKNVTINEPFFVGHFPSEPVMPGVLILESMGQVASVMAAMYMAQNNEVKTIFLAGVDKARFRKPVRPGDKLVTKAELLKLRGLYGRAKAVAYVDDEVAAEAEFLFITGSTLEKGDKNNKSGDKDNNEEA